MNLIDRLGGYSKAKEFVDAESYSIAELQMMRDYNFDWTNVKRELREYRRQNEIYEIGDLVVFKEEYSKDSVIHKIDSLRAGTKCLRHATDEEIEKGCRV
ncbi:hypothetical protein ABSZL4_28 [Acinetobacter phage AB_SZL4]|uniref:Uncharacterized protein n=1 Tax=Acinetobacter phage AbP2 TaxID=2015804 RepID=A0A220NQM5_9CAUD|nr:hypothetical protein FDI25_gp78 [Acinetobacter phage AbP2]ASJ78949.1 hypothetical protein ABP2_078 [Acinetobacter phage AbP2]WPJ68903.1 hypothetical protein ABSZL4_28 [Acinetobacter phage AB_SZL4]